MFGSQGELADAAEAHHLQRAVQRAKSQQHDHASRHVHMRPGNILETKLTTLENVFCLFL